MAAELLVLLASGLAASWIAPATICMREMCRRRSSAAPMIHADAAAALLASGESPCSFATLMRKEIRKWGALALPVACTIFCQNALPLTDMSVLGHLRVDSRFQAATATDFLAAASLANCWIFSLQIVIWAGFVNAINVLCSQAFGAEKHARAAQILMVGTLISVAVCIPVGVAQYFAADVVHRILPATVTPVRYKLIAEYSRVLLVALPAQAISSALMTFLAAAEVVRVPLFISMVTTALNLSWNVVLVHGGEVVGFPSFPGYGFVGSPWASTVTSWTQALLIFGYVFSGAGSEQHVRVRDIILAKTVLLHGQGQHGSSYQPLVTWSIVREYVFDQALPLAVAGALEEWQIQVITFFAGSLSATAVATHNGLLNIFLTVSALNYVSTLIGCANSIRVRCSHQPYRRVS
eukprot:SAG31_NODE_4335_length_3344_cov_2.409245_1_plen_409_part_00